MLCCCSAYPFVEWDLESNRQNRCLVLLVQPKGSFHFPKIISPNESSKKINILFFSEWRCPIPCCQTRPATWQNMPANAVVQAISANLVPINWSCILCVVSITSREVQPCKPLSQCSAGQILGPIRCSFQASPIASDTCEPRCLAQSFCSTRLWLYTYVMMHWGWIYEGEPSIAFLPFTSSYLAVAADHQLQCRWHPQKPWCQLWTAQLWVHIFKSNAPCLVLLLVH